MSMRTPAQRESAAAALASLADSQVASFGAARRSADLTTSAMARFLGATTTPERVSRPFEQSALVHRCIRLICDSLKSMPLMVSTTDDELVESGDAIDLLDAPYEGLSGEDLIEWIAALVMLKSACYLVKGRAGGRLLSLRPVSAEHCQPQYTADGELSGYRYRKPGAHRAGYETLEPDDVVPFIRANFQSERLHDGLSALTPARMSIDQVFGADLANLESLHNGVDPGLALKFPGKPTDDQVRDFRTMLDDRHRGPAKRNRPLFLYDGLELQDFVKKFTEMEFARLKEMSSRDICIALGVPPAVVGLTGEGSLGHGKETQEAHQIFWFVTVLPLAAWIAGKLTTEVLPAFQASPRMFHRYTAHQRQQTAQPAFRAARRQAVRRRILVRHGERAVRESLKLFAWFDSSNVPTVRDAVLARAQQAVILTQDLGATQADVVEAFDLPIPADHPWQQTSYRKMGLVDASEPAVLPGSDDPAAPGGASDQEPDPTSTPAAEGDDEQPRPQAASSRTLGRGPTPAAGATQAKALSEAQLAALWHAWRGSWDDLRRALESKWTRHVFNLRSATLRRLHQVLPQTAGVGGAVVRDVIGQVLFDLTEANGQWLALARPLMRQAYMLGGTQALTEAAAAEGKAEPTLFAIDQPEVLQAMRRREIRLTEPNQTLRRRLANVLADGIAQQESTAKLAERVQAEFNLGTSRSRTIAMTETGGAVEDARQLGRVQAGVPYKSWLSSRKQEARPGHLEAEMQTMAAPIANDALFTLPRTGAQTPHPRGPGLTAADAANCGCTTLARYPGDQVRDTRLLTHLLTRGFFTAGDLARLHLTMEHDHDRS